MATNGVNLSAYHSEDIQVPEGIRVGIAVAEWNKHITGALLDGSLKTLLDLGLTTDQILVKWVPGSFELPLAASWMLTTQNLDGVIVLGCVIQGETRHFDFVCEGVTQGVMSLSLQHDKPVIFGLLTDNNEQQSLDRSGGKHGNKGVECAVSLIKMLALKQQLSAK
ncbi:MAG TPA: 6,7-dimethyl-8-ribityllumazine synthase [Luteibaculaceae bacterium]|nr:6,7-dimethyl-8-ribityllumazine synthase [Luteibaculaceae bacterium]